jgi:hypothetical protein
MKGQETVTFAGTMTVVRTLPPAFEEDGRRHGHGEVPRSTAGARVTTSVQVSPGARVPGALEQSRSSMANGAELPFVPPTYAEKLPSVEAAHVLDRHR